MLRITKAALNQGLRSETVRASSEMKQQSSSLRVPNTLQDDALTSSSRNQLKIEVPWRVLSLILPVISGTDGNIAKIRITTARMSDTAAAKRLRTLDSG